MPKSPANPFGSKAIPIAPDGVKTPALGNTKGTSSYGGMKAPTQAPGSMGSNADGPLRSKSPAQGAARTGRADGTILPFKGKR